MLLLFSRNPKLPAVAQLEPAMRARRNRWQNINVSEDCASAFAEIVRPQSMSKAALFEKTVADRLEALHR